MLGCARTTRAVVWLLRQEGFFCLCYLPRWFCWFGILVSEGIGSLHSVQPYYSTIRPLDKCTPPAHVITWLGFVINTIKMSITIPAEKFSEVLTECKAWKEKRLVSMKQIQSLAGKVQHLSKCVKPAIRFSNRILAALRTTPPFGRHLFDADLLKD